MQAFIRFFIPISILSVGLALAAGCGSSPPKSQAETDGKRAFVEELEQSERELYLLARRYLDRKYYDLAVQYLRQLESQFPFGAYAEQAQLELIYAYYKNYQPIESIEAGEEFIRLHPYHPDLDYVYYLQGLATFVGDAGRFARLFKTDLSQRDMSLANQSMEYFSTLIKNFPSSPYAADAQARIVFLRNLLARHEVSVANYYFKIGAWLAATNRAEYVIQRYPRAPAVADALAVKVQAYRLMGIDDLAADNLRVLVANFPEHEALDEQGRFSDRFFADDRANKKQRSWLNRLTFGLFDRAQTPSFDSRVHGLEPVFTPVAAPPPKELSRKPSAP